MKLTFTFRKMSFAGIYIALIGLFLANQAIAQNGPGGVGSSDGSAGQPRNILWLDANGLSLLPGADVVTWADRSGNGYDAVATAGNEPLFTTNLIGGKPAVQFTSSNSDYLSLNSNIGNNVDGVRSSNYSVIVVGRRKANAVNYLIGSSASNLWLGWDANTANFRYRHRSTNQNMTASTAVNSFGIFCAKYEYNAGGNDLFVGENGNVFQSTANQNSYITTDEAYYLGASSSTLFFYDVDIAEVIFYRAAINNAQRVIVENYLSQKYGIAISNDYYSNSAGYDRDVIGVGQTSGGIHLSASANGFYLDALSGLDNNEFVMAGHNGTDNEPVITDLPVGVVQRYSRDWYIDKTGNLSAKITFDFPEAMQGAKNPQVKENYRLLYRSNTTGNYSVVANTTLALSDADQIAFEVLDADLKDGYYTLGTVNATDSPVSGKDGITWYAYRSNGNWNDVTTWTLDPAAVLYINPAPARYPNLTTENVVIPDGKTVHITHNDISCNNLTVHGRLDVGNATGHAFTTINGSGRILMAADNFPSGDATNFITNGQGQGTVVYYGSSFSLTTNRTFYNMEVAMTSGNILSLRSDITLNGNLIVESGALRFSESGFTASRTLTVNGDVMVNNSTAAITVFNQNASHTFNVYGNIINKGTLQLTNLAVPTYNSTPTSGYVNLFVRGESNTSLEATGPTNLQRLIVDKGSDATYRFTLNPTDKAYFRLFGQNNNAVADKALVIANGTLECAGSTYIHSLTEGTDFEVSQTSALWINGPGVFVQTTARDNTADGFTSVGVDASSGGAQSFTLKGNFKVTDGTFNTNSHGFVVWDEGNAFVQVDGGTVNTPGFRSAGGNSGKWTYQQSGGIVNMYGDYLSDLSGQGAPTFQVKGANNVFIMSGGAMVIYDAATPSNLAIGIESGIGNYSVTGGTVRIYRDSNGLADFNISSTVPFNNFEVQAVNSTYPSVAKMNTSLTVNGNLSIGAYATLDVVNSANTLSVGGDFNLADFGVYTHRNNTTKFVGAKNSAILVSNPGTASYLQFYNLTIEKDIHQTSGSRYQVAIGATSTTGRITAPNATVDNELNTVITINNQLSLIRGNLVINRFTVNLIGDADIADGSVSRTTAAPGRLALTGSSAQTLTASNSYTNSFGRLELFNTNGVSIGSDVTIDELIMERDVILSIADYRLTIGAGGIIKATGSFGPSRMIRTDNSHGAKGVTMNLSIPLKTGGYADNTVFIVFPVGVLNSTNKYLPVQLQANGLYNPTTALTGTINVAPVNRDHPSVTSTGQSMDYYWKVNSTGFAGLDTAKVNFLANTNVTTSNSHEPQYLLGGQWIEGGDHPNGTTIFEYPSFRIPSQVDLSGGNPGAFGRPQTLYSATSGEISSAIWSTTGHDGADRVTPNSYDYLIVGGTSTVNHTVHLSASRTYGKVTINGSVLTVPDGTVPTIDARGWTPTFTSIDGSGKFRRSSNSTLTGDWDGFLTNADATFEYYGGTYTLPTNFAYYPTLQLTGDNVSNIKTLPNVNLRILKDLVLDKNQVAISATANGDLKINGDLRLVNQAVFRFGLTNPRTIEIVGNLFMPLATAADNCAIETTDAAGSVTHNLYVGKDIQIGTSTLRFFRPTRAGVVNLTFNGSAVSRLNSEMIASASINAILNRVTVNKSANTTAVQFYGGTLNAASNGNSDTKPLYLVRGSTTIFNNSLVLSSGGGTFNIPSAATLTVQNATVSLTGNTGVWLDGRLIITTGGVANFNGGTNNFIEYTATGTSRIDVSGTGILRVGSQIRRPLNNDPASLKFYQNASTTTVEIGTVDAPATSRGVFEILNAGSVFQQATNAQITIKRAQSGSTFPDLYLDPATISLSTGSTVNIEGGTSSDAFEIYATKPLRNLNVNGTAVAKLKTLPLTLNGNLTIASGAKLDANGLDLTLNGNMTCNGTYIPNGNTTVFSGSSTQTIAGSVAFFNFNKTMGNTVTLAASTSMVVNGLFMLENGTFNDGGNNVSLKGNIYNSGTSVSTSSEGLVLNGTTEQLFDGSGTYGRLTINNLNGVRNATDGLTLTISQELRMRKGIFAIGRNMLVINKSAALTEVSPYSESNMISTNTSFTDSGIKWYFPSGARTLVYPIGADNKYTPVKFEIANNTSDNGYIRVKAANEPHVTILGGNRNNVLQYNWIFIADQLNNFTATTTMKCYAADIKPNLAAGVNYITARLQNDGSGIWYKYSKDDFYESTNELKFYFTNVTHVALTGDYTAGLDAYIPSTVPKYRSVSNGNWTVGANWINESDNQPAPEGGPSGCIVKVDHAINMDANFISAYTADISSVGSIIVNEGNYGHRLGNVTGSGRMKFFNGDMPAADYTQFVAPGTGTFEFSGSSNYPVLGGFGSVNNVEFTGSGDRDLPNLNLTVNGNLLIDGATLKNENSKIQYVKGNMVLLSGGFVPGTYNSNTTTGCFVQLNGTQRQLLGGFSGGNAFAGLRVVNPNGITLSAPVEVSNTLFLTDGIVFTNNSAKLFVSRASNAAISGTSAASYVDGPLVRNTSATAYFFNVGSKGRHALTTVTPAATSIGNWQVQYHNEASTLSEMVSPVEYVSNNEYWSIQAPAVDKIAKIEIRLDGTSGVNPDNRDDLLIFYRETPALGWTFLSDSITGNLSAGAGYALNVNFDSFTGLGRITFGSKTNESFNWTGATNNDWFVGTNWNKGFVPSAASPVVINNTTNKPVISGITSVAYAKTLEIKSATTLTLNPGGKLSVYGNMTNNGQLIIEHTTERPASFIYNGTTSSGSNTIVRLKDVEGVRYWYHGWPMSGANASGYAPTAGIFASDVLLYRHNFNTYAWEKITNYSENLSAVPMRGYTAMLKNTATIQNTGALNNEPLYSYSITKNVWELLSNPYPSYIDLESGAIGFTNVYNSIYVYTTIDGTRTFSTYSTGSHLGVNDGSRYIAPMQAFWVRWFVAPNAFTISKAAQTHGTGGSLKSAANQTNDVLRLTLGDTRLSDEMALVFRENGSEKFSVVYDSEKRTDAGTSIIYLYSLKDSRMLAINMLPETFEERTIPLGMRVGTTRAGTLTLKATNLNDFMPEVDVWLLDTKTGVDVNLRRAPEYTFTTGAVTDDSRFILHFTKVTTDVKNPEAANADNIVITAIGIGNKCIVKVKDPLFAGKVSIEVLDALGRVHSSVLSNTERTEVPAPTNTQFYVVKVSYKNMVKSFKVMNVMN